MLRFASARLLVPSLSLLCLLALAPASHAQDARLPTPAVQKLADQAKVAQQAGKNEEALRLYNDALTLARQTKDQVGEARMLQNIGNAYLDREQLPKALEFYNQAVPIARAAGDKLTEAGTLTNIGMIYTRSGQTQQALEFLQQALPLHHQLGNKLFEANTLGNLGIVYAQTDQPQKALEFYKQALPLFHAVGNKTREAGTLTNIGLVYDDLKQPQKALEFYILALSLHRQVGNKAFEANTLTNIGLDYYHLRQPRKALEFYQQALPLHRQVGDKPYEANTLTNIGNVYFDMGQPEKALEFYTQALPLHHQVGNREGEAGTFDKIGDIYSNTGQPQKALEFYNQALPLALAIGNKLFEVNVLNNIGNVYSQCSQPQKALEVYQQALAATRASGDRGNEAGALSNIGIIYSHTGQSQKALELFQQAFSLAHSAGNKQVEANALFSMGNAYTNLGQPQKALKFYNQALPLHRQVGNREFETNTLNSIGIIYADIGQPQKALQAYQQALSYYHASGNRYDEAATLTNIGIACAAMGQPQKALKFYNQALPLHRQVGNKEYEANTLIGIAYVEQKRAHPEIALPYARQAVAALEQLRANVGSQGEARSAFLASHLHIYYTCLNLLRETGHVAEAFALTEKTKARSLLDLLASSHIDLNVALTVEERRQLKDLQQQAEGLNRQMLKEGVENEVGAKKRFAALQKQLRQNEIELQLLTDRLYALHPGLADQQQARTATVTDVARLLPSDTALLEYVQASNKELLLFVVTVQAGKPQVQLFPIAVQSAQLQQQCSAFHAVCADPRRNPAALSMSLSRLLLSPASKALAGKKRLIVCPDGALWDVSFAALRAPDNYRTGKRADATLWQQYELSYAYSATGLQAALAVHTRHKPAEHASVLVLANPFFGSSGRFGDLDGVPGQRPLERPSRPLELPSRPLELPSRPLELPSRLLELPSRPLERPSRPLELPSRQLTQALESERGKAIKSLPGAQQEAEAIHKLFPDAAIYTGKAAQEHVVTQEAGKYKYLHFATHGFFNDAAPLLSCIVLAEPENTGTRGNNKVQDVGENTVTVASDTSKPKDAQTEAEDGLLTARKVFGLHLNADLVTLSACNSGRGQVRTGEGIVGLTWALFAAGCPSQVVSQWSVDDAATGQLMADFYKGLKQGKSKSAALRNAALKLSKDGKHQHPYYWTPFFLVGDWK